MYCKSGGNFSWWLLATAVFVPVCAGGVFFTGAGAAAACTQSATMPCARQAPSGWKTVLVDLRDQKVLIQGKLFADRVKRHLRRSFIKRNRQFKRHRVQIK